MECNKEEARRAIETAERKLSEKDHNGAKRFANKAKTLYPTLDGLDQITTMIDVYISASNETKGGESDWYGILGVDPLADEEALKKQYKKLALLLHPDKNRFNGAEGAFKLVLDAWFLLSDKGKRVAYDYKRKRAREVKEEVASKKKRVSSTFWTICTHCLDNSEHVTAYYLDKNAVCPSCREVFVARDMFPGYVSREKPSIRFYPITRKPQATSRSTSDTRMQETPCFRFEDLHSTHEAHRLFSRS